MRVFKEEFVLDPDGYKNVQAFLDGLQKSGKDEEIKIERATISNIAPNSDIYPEMKERINNFCNVDEMTNGLGIFQRTTSINMYKEKLPSLESKWFLDNLSLDNPHCCDKINEMFTEKLTSTITTNLPIRIEFSIADNLLASYTGNLEVSCTDAFYRMGGKSTKKEKEPVVNTKNKSKDYISGLPKPKDRDDVSQSSFGISYKGSMSCDYKYNGEVLSPSYNKKSDRFSHIAHDLDDDDFVAKDSYNRRDEITRKLYRPFNSLFIPSQNVPLISSTGKVYNDNLFNLCITAYNGKLLTPNSALESDFNRCEDWFRAYKASTRIDVEGLPWFKNGQFITDTRKRAVSFIMSQADKAQDAVFFTTQFDLGVYVTDADGNIFIRQAGKLNIVKDERGRYSASVTPVDEHIVEVNSIANNRFKNLDFNARCRNEALVVDNDILRTLQTKFADNVSLSANLGNMLDSDFTRKVVNLLYKATNSFYKGNEVNLTAIYSCFMEGSPKDLLDNNNKEIVGNSEYNELMDIRKDYEFSDLETESISIKLQYSVHIKDGDVVTPIVNYYGTITFILRSEEDTGIEIELKASKKEPSFTPKPYRYGLDRDKELDTNPDDVKDDYVLDYSDEVYPSEIRWKNNPTVREPHQFDKTTYIKRPITGRKIEL